MPNRPFGPSLCDQEWRYATLVIYPAAGELRLTLQTDHARASTEIAAHWGGSFARVAEQRRSVLLATAHHDAGWAECERAPGLGPQGRPYSFLEIPQVQHTQIYNRGVEALRDLDPYAALLTSLHGTGLYNGRHGYLPHIPVRPIDPGAEETVAQFLSAQVSVQAELIALLQPDETLLWTYYRWLQAWDALTVMMAMFSPADGQVLPQGVMPLAPGGAAEPLTLRGAGADTWTLAPWPFETDRFDLGWPVRYVADRAYDSPEAFQEAFYSARTTEQRVTLLPA